MNCWRLAPPLLHCPAASIVNPSIQRELLMTPSVCLSVTASELSSWAEAIHRSAAGIGLEGPSRETAQRQVVGHSRPWVSGHNQAAMCRLPAGQPLLAVNDRLLVQAAAGPDPEETFAV